MQVFKAFLKTAQKSLPVMVLYFAIFSFIALWFSFSASGPETSSFRTAELSVGVIDRDKTASSKALLQYMDSMHELTPMEYDRDALLDGLFYRELDYILILPEGFEEKLLGGDCRELFETVRIPGIYGSIFLDEQINAYIKTVSLYLAGGFGREDALDLAKGALKHASNQVQTIDFDAADGADDAISHMYIFYRFLPYVLMSMVLCGLTPILVAFREENLAKRMSCSSTSLSSRNLQLALGSIVLSIGIWLAFALLAGIVFGAAAFSEQGLFCMANSFLLMPLAIGISLIVGSFAPSFNAINMINNIISLGMSFLCGVFIQQQLLGEELLAVSKFLPFYWYIKNNDLIAGNLETPFTSSIFLEYAGIQILFIAAAFAAAMAACSHARPMKRKSEFGS